MIVRKSQIDMNEFAELVRKYTHSVNTILDVGALDGADAVLLKHQFPKARVVAIEGLPDHYEHFNDRLTEVEYYHAVIAEGSRPVLYHRKAINGRIIGVGCHGIYDRGAEYGTDSVLLTTVSITDFCHIHGIEQIDVMKLDVEGATYDVFKGMSQKLLESIQIMHVETESYPFFAGQKLHKDVEELLGDCFKMVMRGDVARGLQHDCIWVSRNNLRDVASNPNP